jgi:hypothetical protein
MRALLTDLVSSDNRPVTRKLRELLPQIEAAVTAGHKHADIHAALLTYGMAISFKNYKRVLARLRKEALSRAHEQQLCSNSSGAGNYFTSSGQARSSGSPPSLRGLTNAPFFRSALEPESSSTPSTLEEMERREKAFDFDPRKKIDPFNRKGNR